jgi:hypothetical protein
MAAKTYKVEATLTIALSFDYTPTDDDYFENDEGKEPTADEVGEYLRERFTENADDLMQEHGFSVDDVVLKHTLSK